MPGTTPDRETAGRMLSDIVAGRVDRALADPTVLGQLAARGLTPADVRADLLARVEAALDQPATDADRETLATVLHLDAARKARHPEALR